MGVWGIQPRAVGGAEEDGFAQAQGLGIGLVAVGGFEVGLVQQQQDRFVQFAQALGQGSVGGEDAAGAIQDEDDNIGLGGGGQGEVVEGGLELGEVGLRLIQAAVGFVPLPFASCLSAGAGLFDAGGID
ncbi:MAG: hypothetical protein EBR79_03890 [Proteobacteria bacterium]|nr:hypothetical protein [Pseudomonadota bacterium]